MASAEGQRSARIAAHVGCAVGTIHSTIHAFEKEGMDCLGEKKRGPKDAQLVLDEGKADPLKGILQQAPRRFGKARSTWTLDLLADVAFEQELTPRRLSPEAVRQAVKCLGCGWKRAKQWITIPDPAYGRKTSTDWQVVKPVNEPNRCNLFHMRNKGTAVELESRRRLAVQRVGEGCRRADVAAFLGVHPETVAEWVRAHKRGGDKALAAKPHPGRTPFLTADQEKQVLGWLANPPTKHGFRTDLWSARRVADLIRTKLGVEFNPHYLREWLTKRNYTPQKPARRAKQRNPEAVAGWRKDDWPRVQKKSRRSTPTSS